MRSAIGLSFFLFGAGAAWAADGPGKPSQEAAVGRPAAPAPAGTPKADGPADLDEPAELDANDLDAGAGNLSQRVIADVVKKGAWQVTDCFQRHGLKGQGGRLLVEYEIGLDGAVTRAESKESSVNNPVLQSCILSAMKRLKFPPPEGGTVIASYPFVFG